LSHHQHQHQFEQADDYDDDASVSDSAAVAETVLDSPPVGYVQIASHFINDDDHDDAVI